MVVELGKIESQAPHLVKLTKEVGVQLEKRGLNPAVNKAAVEVVLDHSGSTEDPRWGNRLYSDGTMGNVLDMAFAAGLQFDDDGKVPVVLFDNQVYDMGEMDLDNCKGFINRHRRYPFGGTSYVQALRWIVKSAGFERVNLGQLPGPRRLIQEEKRNFWGKVKQEEVWSDLPAPLSIKATAAYPTYAVVVTDGEPQDPEATAAYLTLMSQLPIFVQFIGVGNHRFEFLEELDTMEGRFIDNANFFDSREAKGSTERMLELMLGEFPDYYRKAREIGLLRR